MYTQLESPRGSVVLHVCENCSVGTPSLRLGAQIKLFISTLQWHSSHTCLLLPLLSASSWVLCGRLAEAVTFNCVSVIIGKLQVTRRFSESGLPHLPVFICQLLRLMPMFGLIGFCSLAQLWSSGQRDVGSMSTTHPQPFVEWSGISFLLFPSSLLSYLVCTCLHFHAHELFLVYFTFYHPLISLFILQSQMPLKACLHSLTFCPHLIFTHHPVSPFSLLKHFTPRPPMASILPNS